MDIAFGGGHRNFIDKNTTDLEGKTGKRKDRKYLTRVWQQKSADWWNKIKPNLMPFLITPKKS